jgi:hypothetical protein
MYAVKCAGPSPPAGVAGFMNATNFSISRR